MELRDIQRFPTGLYCREALEAAPGTPSLVYRMARAVHAYYLYEGQPEQYVKLYAEAADLGYAPAQYDLGVLYLEGNSVSRDPARAAELFRKAADQGLAQAQQALGRAYLSGDGVEKNAAEATAWLTKAADQGLASAQFELGQALASGGDLPQDHTNAAAWLRKAADQGHADAQFSLGLMYRAGQGVAKDEKEAKRWLASAANLGNQSAVAALAASTGDDERKQWREQLALGLKTLLGEGVPKDVASGVATISEVAKAGYPDAQFTLAMLYAGGHGVPADKDQMMHWLAAAANQGNAAAQISLGELLWESAESLDRWEEARAWLIRAAEQGGPYAQYRLGNTYISGSNGNFWNVPEAMRWFTKAAEQGFPPAQVALGIRYWEGDFRSPDKEGQDYAKAVHWLSLALGRDNGTAATFLGWAYAGGLGGLPKDEKMAVKLWLEAAKKNHARAEEALGYAYRDGKGVPQDAAEAQKWFGLAASHGSQGAQEELKTPAMAAVGNEEKTLAILAATLALMLATSTGEPVYSEEPSNDFGENYQDWCASSGIAADCWQAMPQ